MQQLIEHLGEEISRLERMEIAKAHNGTFLVFPEDVGSVRNLFVYEGRYSGRASRYSGRASRYSGRASRYSGPGESLRQDGGLWQHYEEPAARVAPL